MRTLIGSEVESLVGTVEKALRPDGVEEAAERRVAPHEAPFIVTPIDPRILELEVTFSIEDFLNWIFGYVLMIFRIF